MVEKPVILAVDDEPLILQLIANYLKNIQPPCEVELAQNGEQAWQLLEENPERYDICLIDRMMGGMDGIEVLQRMRSHWLLRDIPVILQTSKTAQEEIIEGMNAGAYYYLAKPIEKNLFVSVVNTALSDRLVHKALKNKLKDRDESIRLLKNASFEFKTIQEANSLASLLANTCPNPTQVVAGLGELLFNAIEHGNLGISYCEKSQLRTTMSFDDEIQRRLNHSDYSERIATIKVSSDAEKIEFIISDEGEGFDWEPYLDFGVSRMMDNHGRGIALANQLAFHFVEYLGKGNIVKATVLK